MTEDKDKQVKFQEGETVIEDTPKSKPSDVKNLKDDVKEQETESPEQGGGDDSKEEEEEEASKSEPAVSDKSKNEIQEDKKEVLKDEIVKEDKEPKDQVISTSAGSAVVGAASDEVDEKPPPPPPRPVSPYTRAVTTLQEAFPDVDAKVIRAVLVAAQGQMDPAFNGLLAMNDPAFKPESIRFGGPSSSSGRQSPAGRQTDARRRQIEQDEALARRLAQGYGGGGGQGAGSRYRGNRPTPPPPSSGYSGRYNDARPLEPERSFFDDDLPEIRENLQKGFEETKEKVTQWMTNLRRRIDGEDGQPGLFSGGSSPRTSSEQYGRYSNSPSNNNYNGNGKYNNRPRMYDQDHSEIDDDFQGIQLRDSDEEEDNRPLRTSAPGGGGARSSGASANAQGRPVGNRPRAVSALGDESPPPVAPASSKAAKNKWEPLNPVAPEPSADKDPFFIGDSDDEDDK